MITRIMNLSQKDSMKRALIQNFHIRGKAVYCCIRSRGWPNKSNKSIAVKSDYSFIEAISKLTIELSDFLNGKGRDPRRSDK